MMQAVIIVWYDISKTFNDDYFDENKNIDSRLIQMTTIGWLYKESTTVVLIIQEFQEGKPRDYVTIPKSLIKEIIKIGSA